MKKVLLIQPRIGLLDDLRSRPEPPLNLMFLASNMPKGITPIIFDQRLSRDWKTDIDSIMDRDVDCAAVTSMTSLQLLHAREISQYLKNKYNLPIIWGGPHATILPIQIKHEPYVDYVIIGEGEKSLPALVKSMGSQLVINQGKLLDLTKIKMPDFSFIDYWKYCYKHRVFGKSYLTTNIQTSRGCPNNCSYCYNKIANRHCWRSFTTKAIIDHIKQLYILGIKSLFVVDDNFFIDLKRAEEIFRQILKHKLDIKLSFQGICVREALKMDHYLLKLMEKAGVIELWFGIESGSPGIRKIINKVEDVNEIIEANKKLSNYKFSVQYNFMSGFPYETVSDLKKTINLIFKLMKDNPNAACRPMTPFVPYPGTVLFDDVKKLGFNEPRSVQEYISLFRDIHNQYMRSTWVSDERRKLLEKIHLLSMFYNRDLQYIDSIPARLLLRLYRPIANFRLKNFLLKRMPEFYLFNGFKKLAGFGFK